MTHNSIDRNRDELKTIIAEIEDAIHDLELWSIHNADEFNEELNKIIEILEEIK